MSIYQRIGSGAGFLLLLALAGLAAGCGGVQPNRPAGNLGDSVNSVADEFAPALRPGRSAIYFTSNREQTEDIWRAMVSDPAAERPAFTAAEIDASDISLLSQPTTNDGAVLFVSPGEGFFASGHAPDSLYAEREGSFGGIVGGTDLFAFTAGGNGVHNLGPAINSIFWDSHPAAGGRGDSLLLIFSSDRPAGRHGYSSPYREAITLRGSGDSVKGNADLYYVFRIGGRWGEVRNMNDVAGEITINSKGNEYSPYLYCIDHAPRLLFASNRGGSFDLWEAGLLVNFARGVVSVAGVSKLPAGIDSINSAADELFPFMTAPADAAGGQYLYFASNRDNESRQSGAEKVQGVGGFDLYRFPFARECSAPKLRYEVTVLDAENPSRAVLGPVVRLHRTAGPVLPEAMEPQGVAAMESRSNPAVFEVDLGEDYLLYGGSAYNEIHCESGEPAVESYSFLRVSNGEPEIRKRTSWGWRDTLERAQRVTHIDTTLRVDTVPLASASSIASTPGSIIRSISAEGGNLLVTRMEFAVREELIGGTLRKYKAQIVEYDTLRKFDSIWIPTTRNLAPSERVKRHGTLALPAIAADITIRDTVYVHPNYYQPPPCQWLYTRSILDEYRKNVPYFQTAFWEVNTAANLRRDLRRLDAAQYADAGFVELHSSNLYFGQATGRRARRIGQYEEFARTVDRNLDQMASEVAEGIIPEFIDYDAKTPGSNNKLVIQVLAYSDIRPIVRGQYIGGETVRYVGGSYDSSSSGVKLHNVEVAPGASLVSESNDTLSKLRVYYGYQELIGRLRKYPAFEQLVADGTILLPVGLSPGEYRTRMENAKILVMMEGRYADRSEQPSVSGYTGRGDDFYALDDIRRMDVLVNRLEYINGRLMKSPCCTPVQKLSDK